MSGFRVVLDTCVLVPIDQTDLLLTLAQRGIFHPLWSDAILGELSYAILDANPKMTPERVERRLKFMNDAFEDALVEGWEPLENCVTGMKDPDDRHIVAAAIRGNAGAIVTENIKDFPDAALQPWGLHAVRLDEFLLDVLDLSPNAVFASLIEISDKRENPPVTVDQLLSTLARSGAHAFADEVRSLMEDGS